MTQLYIMNSTILSFKDLLLNSTYNIFWMYKMAYIQHLCIFFYRDSWFKHIDGIGWCFPPFFLGLGVQLIQLQLTVCNLLTSFVHFNFLFWIKQMNYKQQYQQDEKLFYTNIYVSCLLVTKLQHVNMIIGHALIAIIYSLCIMNYKLIIIFVHLSFFYKK